MPRKPRDPNAPPIVRSPQQIMLLITVLDENGEPVEVPNNRITVKAFHKSQAATLVEAAYNMSVRPAVVTVTVPRAS